MNEFKKLTASVYFCYRYEFLGNVTINDECDAHCQSKDLKLQKHTYDTYLQTPVLIIKRNKKEK